MTPADTMLFVATFADGHQIFQTSDDKSLTGGANCYSDVLAYEQTSKLISFIVRDEQSVFGVDLQDGHFETNGVPFFMHRYDHKDQQLTNFRLIWFRTTRISTVMGGAEPETQLAVSYNLGWQTNDAAGNNVQRVLKTRPFKTTDKNNNNLQGDNENATI